MSSDADRLLDALRETDRRHTRRSLEQVWTSFRQVVRGYTGEVEARAKLAGLLAELDDGARLVLPRSNRLWNRAAEPPLPMWVRLVKPPRSSGSVLVSHRAVAWPPELAFVSRLARAPLLDELLAVKRFLASGGRERRFVPSRERSLELFGDEKRLDALQRTSLFEPGHLSLEVLRCFDVAPPLVWEGGPAPTARPDERAMLVVENLHTYDTLRRVNARRGTWAAVAYGHGSEFKATVRDLPRVCELLELAQVEYFGDLDGEGLAIPVYADGVLFRMGTALRIEPSARLYELLLAHGAQLRLPDSGGGVNEQGLGWLPGALREAARQILEEGFRVPQEVVGLELLEGSTALALGHTDAP